MQLIICNNTKENFLWVPEKINVKFHKITSYTWNFQNLPILPVFSQFLWNLTFIFSHTHKLGSFVIAVLMILHDALVHVLN